MAIGFIGLGNMGAPMAINLAKAGHDVMGLDVSASIPALLEPASSLADLASQSDTIVTMLPNGAIMRDVISSALPHAKPGTLFLDCSTVDVASARDAAEQIESAGHAALDAPVSGGTAGAIAGTLTFMAGGSDKAFTRARPLLDIMGAKMFHCGGNGSGQAAKICNNMILGISMIATCEAFALADGLGLDRQALFDVVSASSGQSWSMTTYCPAPGVGPQTPADNDYKPGFATDLMLKDLTLSQQAAQASDVDTALGEQARQLYQAFAKEGGAGRDFSAILERIKTTPR
ncbi:MAG: 3-hydroxyisobutyrate dehydrogenase [Rhizobiales bacterium]|nr:3-hydroxyisobutyrate dehydrogenase [Hyphomicrobiales bacterium]MBO6699920.1 3-hydroxyisobutyrate dehydrogenase [Hyphomicrobiales bacterium]MBO6737458.1 3-hydroxyisobutyrate dehydrogenase [Hyphomicrobiales bacterium]MBO6911468.1 3-hydroxyisobutyrate dehydrogenase [Hyphomicrobiales bacterium]MBO6955232.1 3-hydroxyisobutyrate dehydrogenase [Hyphomicrobiales bacterium]